MSKQNENGFYKWDKSEVIIKKLENERNLSWYTIRYRRNINISFVLVILSLIMTTLACYKIKSTSDDREIFITSTSGDVIHYNMTEEKRKLLNNALNKL